MDTIRILLVCGSGASSGFMAANMRKAAKARGIDVTVTARSESEIENYIEDIDVIMVGPHLAYIIDEAEEIVDGRDVKIILMKGEYYATFDGDQAIDHMMSSL